MNAAGTRIASGLTLAASVCAGIAWAQTAAHATESAAGNASFLVGLHHHATLTSTVPGNGDQNPYAIVVATTDAGAVQRGDVLVSNFNDRKNLQGLGTTIVDWRPSSSALSTFATLPRALPGCPGGIGLTTAMTRLGNGVVIVGSLPSNDGNTATKGQGCLVVLGPDGKLLDTVTGPDINGPWGNMALREHPGGGTLFVSMTGFGVGAADGTPPVVKQATILRLELAYGAEPATPKITARTVIADGLSEQADKSVFIVGPTGLALDASGTLYVSDAIANRVVAIDDALTRTTSAGQGREITKDGLLNRPLAMIETPDRHLVVTNGLNGQAVEIDAATGTQLGAKWLDTDKAQSPPGSGDLFGIALTPDNAGLYYVEDDVNTLVQAK